MADDDYVYDEESGEWVPELMLAQHFAAVRHAATVSERERCVEVIREADRKRFAKCLLEDAEQGTETVAVYFTAAELITQLTEER